MAGSSAPVFDFHSPREAGFALPSPARFDPHADPAAWEPPPGARFTAEGLANGDSFSGYAVDGQRHGPGLYRYANGSEYEGDWADGVIQGWGVMTDVETEEQFKGYWWAGERRFGILVTRGGEVYQGGFCRNKRHGRGVLWEKRLMYEVVYNMDVCLQKHLWSIVLGDIAHAPLDGTPVQGAAAHPFPDADAAGTVEELQQQNAALSQRVAFLEGHVALVSSSPPAKTNALDDPVVPVLIPTGPRSPSPTSKDRGTKTPRSGHKLRPASVSKPLPASPGGRSSGPPELAGYERLLSLNRNSRLLVPTAASVAKMTTRLTGSPSESPVPKPVRPASPSSGVERPSHLSSSLLRPSSPSVRSLQSPIAREDSSAYDFTTPQLEQAFRFYRTSSAPPT
eukprot:EG_transcript_12871